MKGAYKKELYKVLKELCIWNKMSAEEKKKFKSLENDSELDHYRVTLIYKYL